MQVRARSWDFLDLILSCLSKLSQAFTDVESQVESEQGLKSTVMLAQLSDAVSNLNHSRLFFRNFSKVFNDRIVYRVTLRHLRLREHCEALGQLLETLTVIKAAELIEECKLRDSLKFGNFQEVHELLIKERPELALKRFGIIIAILGSNWMLDEDTLNAQCYVLIFNNPRIVPLLLKENTLLGPSETLEEFNLSDSIPRVTKPEVSENEETVMLEEGYSSDECMPAV